MEFWHPKGARRVFGELEISVLGAGRALGVCVVVGWGGALEGHSTLGALENALLAPRRCLTGGARK